MSAKNTRNKQRENDNFHLSSTDGLIYEPEQYGFTRCVKRHWAKGAVVAFVLLLGLGVMAKNGWLPRTDPLSGKKTGWFGRVLSESGAGATGLNPWNPFAAPPSSPIPQLSKEYIYAGSRLLAVADANANTAPTLDLAVWRPSNGYWIIFDGDSTEPPPAAQLGIPGDIPVLGDFDGDGKTDFAVFRPSEGRTHIIRSSTLNGYTVQLGTSSDIPVAADHDGDGMTDVVLWAPSNQDWKVNESSTNINRSIIFTGINGDKPVPCDFDGDGKADTAYWRSSDSAFVSVDSADGTLAGQSYIQTDLEQRHEYLDRDSYAV